MKIILNRCKCLKCGDIITSRHVHDFVMCGCGAIFTDGGTEYCRRGGHPEFIEDMSITDNGLAIIMPDKKTRTQPEDESEHFEYAGIDEEFAIGTVLPMFRELAVELNKIDDSPLEYISED